MLQSREFKELRKPDGYPRRFEKIGDYIKAERLDRGLTQTEVAEILEVDTYTILNWEKGIRQPRIS